MNASYPILSERRARIRANAASMKPISTVASTTPNVPSLSALTLIAPNSSRTREPPVSAQVRLATLAHFISDNKWSAFADHIAAFPHDAKVTDPKSGRPLLYHAIELHRNDFAHFLLSTYAPAPAVTTSTPAASIAQSPMLPQITTPPSLNRYVDYSTDSVLGDNLGRNLTPNPSLPYSVTCSPMSDIRSNSDMSPPFKHARPAMKLSDNPRRPANTVHPVDHALNFCSTTRDFQGNSPLIIATQAKNTDMCETLLQQWPRMLHCSNVHGVDPLLAACRVGSEHLVTLFLDLGANLSHADHDGNTALHHASAYNHFSIVALLVARGGNFMVRNRKQWTALDYAYSETLQAFFQDLVRDIVLGETNFGYAQIKNASSQSSISSPFTRDKMLQSSNSIAPNNEGSWLDHQLAAAEASDEVSNLDMSYFTKDQGSPTSVAAEPKPTLVSYNAFLE